MPSITTAQNAPDVSSYSSDSTALRLDPVADVVADLEEFIPQTMQRYAIPGLSIALIRDNEVVWEEAFGIVNTITRRRMTTETALPAASIGKPAAAYSALRLVDSDSLSLDEPITNYVDSNWPDEDVRKEISLRHLLAHTSGLSNFLGDKTREVKFSPGQEFSYSGVGYMYLQEVLEEITEAPLDSLAGRELFRPHGMASWFGRNSPTPQLDGHGHIPLLRAIIPFGIVFGALAIVLYIIALCMSRIVRKRWRVPRVGTLLFLIIAAAVAVWFLMTKASDPRMVPFFVIAFLSFTALTVLPGLLMSVFLLRRRIVRVRHARIVGPVLVVVSIMLIGLPLLDQPIPVPKVTGPNGNAASSLKSTAGDVGRLAIALAQPRNLSAELAEEMISPQVEVSEHLRWGLGVGIQESSVGPALFHWGRNPAVRAAFVIYPETGVGAAVLINLGDVGEAAAEIIPRAIGGPLYWAEE